MGSQIPQEKNKSPVGKGEGEGEMENEEEREREMEMERKGDPEKDVCTKQQSILGHVEQGK